MSYSISGMEIILSGADLTVDSNEVGSGASRIRILIIDKHRLLSQGLKLAFKTQPGLEIVGDASNRDDAIEIANREQPDVILLDPSLDQRNDQRIIAELLAAVERAHIIILTGERDLKMYRAALTLGARGIVQKQESIETLIQAIKKVQAGDVWLERENASNLLADVLNDARSKKEAPETAQIRSLTQREREVVTLVADGLKNKQIAERLFITQATVSHHLTSIFNKLGVSDRLQLIVYAYKHKLGKPDC